MAEYLIQETTLIEIANAIRNKADKTDRIPVSKFAEEINALKAGGNPPTVDDTLPADASCVIGSSVVCHVLVHGENIEEYTYQWYVNNVAVVGATESSYVVNGTEIGTMTVYCNVTNTAGTTSSRVATITVKSGIPSYTYSGTSALINEGNNNWNIKFTTTGNLNFTELGNAVNGIEVCLVGGGTGGGSDGGAGGTGGAVVNTQTNLNSNTNYVITIGAANGASSAFGFSASHGRGSAGGAAGTNGANGTYAFNDSKYARYGAGGGGGAVIYGPGSIGPFGRGGDYGGGDGGNAYLPGGTGYANTGGGGGGGGMGAGSPGGAGGSGVVIIRNKRS